jgi:3-oxoacyl-[acyl-carrier-protein] synthase III
MDGINFLLVLQASLRLYEALMRKATLKHSPVPLGISGIAHTSPQSPPLGRREKAIAWYHITSDWSVLI